MLLRKDNNFECLFCLFPTPANAYIDKISPVLCNDNDISPSSKVNVELCILCQSLKSVHKLKQAIVK